MLRCLWCKIFSPKKEEKNSEDSLHYFQLSQELFYKKKFKPAEHYLSYYRTTVDYDKFDKSDHREGKDAEISVIIVTYNARGKLLACLKSLSSLKNHKTEVIIVDNGRNDEVIEEIKKLPVLYIRTPQNLLLSEGRNIGVYFSRAEIIAFLDDDATVNTDYISSIIRAFRKYRIHALRGRVLPQNKPEKERITHYDLGMVPFPSIINAEGNSAFLKKTYLEFTGMNPLLFGHEGWEISCKIIEKYGYSAAIYWPETVIYHDFSDDPEKIKAKNERHALMSNYVKRKLPAARKIRKKMKKFYENEDAKIKASTMLIVNEDNSS